MHDYDHYCSLSWSLPVSCQPSPVLSMSSTRASNYQKPKVCQMCPPYLPICGISPPLQVNFSCATFKLFKIVIIPFCVNVYQLMRKQWVILYSTCQTDFTPGLVAYSSAYPIILQKELATGCPVPINYNFNHLILFTFLP